MESDQQPGGKRTGSGPSASRPKKRSKAVPNDKAPGAAEASKAEEAAPAKKAMPEEELVELRGELLIANATKKSVKQSGEIEIVTSGNVRQKVVVPPGMMSDIVKPLWEPQVDVIGVRRGKRIHLMQIKAAP